MLADPYLYLNSIKLFGFNTILSGRSAILIKNHIPFSKIETNLENVSAIESSGIVIISVYYPPDVALDSSLNALSTFIAQLALPAIIGGDFNAISYRNSSEKSNAKGTIIESFIDDNNLFMANSHQPTRYWSFCNEPFSSAPDYTLSSTPSIVNWEVYDENLLSDHRLIKFEVDNTHKHAPKMKINIDHEHLLRILSELNIPIIDDNADTNKLDEYCQNLAEILSTAVKEASTVIHHQNKIIWWTEDLESIKILFKKIDRMYYKAKSTYDRFILRIIRSC